MSPSLRRLLLLAAILLLLLLLLLLFLAPHLSRSRSSSAEPAQNPSAPATLSGDRSTSGQSKTTAHLTRPAAASPEKQKISPIDNRTGNIDPAWLASRGIAGDRAEEATRVIAHYRQLSADLLISRLIPAPGENSLGQTGRKAYRLAPPDPANASSMDEMRAALRLTFGGSAGELLFRDLEFESQFSGFWAGTGDIEFLPLPDGEVRWKFVLRAIEPQGGSGVNGLEMIGRGAILSGAFGADFRNFY